MGKVRLQVRYWEMVHHGIKLAMEEIKKQIEEEEAKTEHQNWDKVRELRDDLLRYEEIEKLIIKAKRWDGPFTSPLGPDVPPPEESTPEEEMKWRNIMSID